MHRIDRLPVHGHDGVAGLGRDTGSGEWGARRDDRGLSPQHPADPPGPVLVRGEIRAEQALGQRLVRARRRRPHVGVRGAELALHLPEQVVQVVLRADPVQQRPVALGHGRPVDPGHVGAPEVVPHQPPGLVEHLRPLGRRIHGDPDPVQVHGDRVFVVLRVGGLHLQLPAVRIGQPRAVAGDGEVVKLLEDRRALALLQVVADQAGLGMLVGRTYRRLVQLTRARIVHPHHAALDRVQRPVAAGLDRERHNAVLDALEVDDDRGCPRVGI